MSYVTLPIHLPRAIGAEASYEEQKAVYDACVRTNRDANAAYEAAFKKWKAAKKAHEAFVLAAKRASGQNAKLDADYASKQATYAAKASQYKTAMATWLDKKARHDACVAQKQQSDLEQQRQAEAVAKTYGVTLPKSGTWWCISPTAKQKAERECAAVTQTVRGIGALNPAGLHVCMLKNYPACKTWSCPSDPGHRPRPPTRPGDPPKHVPTPPPVPGPGDKPKPPLSRECGPAPVAPAMGLGTAGLIAILALGGGVVGYRWYKKRKKATG